MFRLGSRDIYNEFDAYGYCDITTVNNHWMPVATAVPVIIYVRIILDPMKFCSDGSSDTAIRQAIYGLAEAAIAYAKKHYRLIDAPRLEISGQMHRHLGEDPIIVTSGILELRICERD